MTVSGSSPSLFDAGAGRRFVTAAAIVPFALATAAVLVLGRWPLNLLLLAAAATALVALIRPPIALGLLAASVPAQDLVDQRLGPIELRWTSALLLALTGVWLVRSLTAGRRPRATWLALPMAVHVLVVAASIVAARNVPAWVAELSHWLAALIVLVIAVDVVRDARSARPALLGMVVGVGAVSLLGSYQALAGVGPPSFAVGGFTRAYGTFGQPNPFAGYLELSVPLLLAFGGARLQSGRRAAVGQAFGDRLLLGCGVAAVLGTVALLLSQSRGGLLGALVGWGAVAWLTFGPRRLFPVLAVAVLGVLVVAPIGDRLVAGAGDALRTLRGEVQVTPANFATQERLAHWRVGLRMTRTHPLLGVGAGNFSDRFRDFTPTWRFRVSRGHAHSNYVQAAAQTGLLGLASYLALLATVGARLTLALRQVGPDPARPLVVGALGSTLALVVHGALEYLHVLSLGLQLSLVWGMAESGRRAASGGSTRIGTEGA